MCIGVMHAMYVISGVYSNYISLDILIYKHTFCEVNNPCLDVIHDATLDGKIRNMTGITFGDMNYMIEYSLFSISRH